jgi:outer membrane biosynthesis protein TonB
LSNVRTHGGVLLYEVTIGTSGNVTDARLVKRRERFTPSAQIANLWLDAIQDWKFEPTVIHNNAVPVCMTVTVTIDVK